MFNIYKFGAYLSKLRKEKDMTQSELADILNVTRQAVSKYENGDSFPDISVLIVIAKTFNITLDQLINAGEPSKVEKEVLTHAALNNTNNLPDELFPTGSDLVNIAPLLRPSTLEVIASRFQKHKIDISNITRLAEYVNEKTMQNLLDKATFDKIDKEMLTKFIPFLDYDSKINILDKIFNEELDPELIEVLIDNTPNIFPLVENAVVCGVLDQQILRKYKEK